ncbi:FG-GAP repeat protein [Streptomyces sp. KMM 9044]|uniref:FG-GAP repeat protein n=1 Tax=Streptomyces sp. KMM 9044 TaxID=2744474 RepID=UPI003FA759E3
MAVGAPGATVGGRSKAGAVSVVYGGSSGPKTSTRTLVTQNTAGVSGTAEAGDAFGAAPASADLNTDGSADLLIGAPGEDTNGDSGNSTSVVVWGSKSGLSGARTLFNFSGRNSDRYGQALSTGDFDDDGDLDVVVGSTGPVVLSVVDGPLTRTGAHNGGSGSQYDWWSSSPGITHLTSADAPGDGRGPMVLHGRAAHTGDTATSLAYLRIGNSTDWLRRMPTGCVSAAGHLDRDGHPDFAVGNGRATSADPEGVKGIRALRTPARPERRRPRRPRGGRAVARHPAARHEQHPGVAGRRHAAGVQWRLPRLTPAPAPRPRPTAGPSCVGPNPYAGRRAKLTPP